MAERPNYNTGKTTGRFKCDWAEAERFFMYDPSLPTIRQVAQKFNVSYLTAHKHATRRDWARRRMIEHDKLNEQVVARMREEFVEARLLRLRRLTRLIDAALDDAVTEPDEAVPHILKLIQCEREIIAGLPPDRARDRVLREHVDRALTIGGLQNEEKER